MQLHITWTNYFEAVTLLAVIYYFLIGLHYYGSEVQLFIYTRILKDNQDVNRHVPFFSQEPETAIEELEVSYPPIGPVIFEEAYEETPADTMREADELIGRIKAGIKQTSGKPYNPPALVQKIKAMFMDADNLRHSPHRDAINELIVTECERTGTALLTEDEVDRWWGD